MITEENKNLDYWKGNAEEDYMQVPISVLRYISELEEAVKNCSIPDVISRFSDEKLAEIADKQVHISNGCFGELDFTQGKREGFEDGLVYFRDVLLNGL